MSGRRPRPWPTARWSTTTPSSSASFRKRRPSANWPSSTSAPARPSARRRTASKTCAPSPGSSPGCSAATPCPAGTASARLCSEYADQSPEHLARLQDDVPGVAVLHDHAGQRADVPRQSRHGHRRPLRRAWSRTRRWPQRIYGTIRAEYERSRGDDLPRHRRRTRCWTTAPSCKSPSACETPMWTRSATCKWNCCSRLRALPPGADDDEDTQSRSAATCAPPSCSPSTASRRG